MAKKIGALALDAALSVVAGADLMVALPSEPVSYAAAQSAKLAEVAMTGADFSIGAGSAGARALAVAGKNGVSVGVTDDATHVALLDTGAGELLYVTTCPTESLDVTGTVDFDGFTVEAGPVA